MGQTPLLWQEPSPRPHLSQNLGLQQDREPRLRGPKEEAVIPWGGH